MAAVSASDMPKLRSAIKAKLTELGACVVDVLPDYIMTMVANKKSKQQMADNLKEFLGKNSAIFIEWLHGVLERLQSISRTAPSAAAVFAANSTASTVKETKNRYESEKKSPVHRKKISPPRHREKEKREHRKGHSSGSHAKRRRTSKERSASAMSSTNSDLSEKEDEKRNRKSLEKRSRKTEEPAKKYIKLKKDASPSTAAIVLNARKRIEAPSNERRPQPNVGTLRPMRRAAPTPSEGIDFERDFVTWFLNRFHPAQFALATTILSQLVDYFGGPMQCVQDFVAFRKQAVVWDQEVRALKAGKKAKQPYCPFGIVGLKAPVLHPNRYRGVPSTRCFQCQGRGHRSLNCNLPCWKCGRSHKSSVCSVKKCNKCLQVGHENTSKTPCTKGGANKSG